MMDSEEVKLTKRKNKLETSGKLDELVSCCRRIADYHCRKGHYEQALEAFREELRASELKNDEEDIANAHRMIGEMCSTLGLFEEALERANKYLNFAKEKANVVEEQRAWATIGRTYFCWAVEMQQDEELIVKCKLPKILKNCRKAYMKSLCICEEELKNIPNRERQEMTARILFNLGLACEVECELDQALDYILRSVAICRKEQLFEDLHRCLLSLVTINLGMDNTVAALRSADEAIEAAKKLENHVEARVTALIRKAEVYLAMSNYSGARKVLKTAFKLKSPISDDRYEVECSLKRAIVLCDLEKDLVTTSPDLVQERKKLYERFGDQCCRVKNFKHAIKCYLNMLECAQTLGETGTQLLPCYVSLSQTYRDSKNYDMALEYAMKELEISVNVPKEAAKTHVSIGEILEIKGSSFEEISHEYSMGLLNARQAKSPKLEALCLNRLLSLQRAHGRMDIAKQTKRELTTLGAEESSDSEREENPEDDVHLSQLSDSDEDIPRVSRNTFKVTRNEKGETPLHVAAIKGDVTRARRLISMGHPVKEKDLAGWTPLHEAANHGHMEMVQLLIEAGANINDPGGKDCGGVTPLHDSACCGHFEIIRYLIDHGAVVTALTNEGETPLDCLREWRRRVDDLDDESEISYKELVKNLSGKLAAAGIQHTEQRSSSYRQPGQERSTRRENRKHQLTNENTKERLGNLRRQVNLEEELYSGVRSISPISSENNYEICKFPSPASKGEKENNPPKHKSSVSDYRATMSNIRKRPLSVEFRKPVLDSPLVDADGYVEEWLEDDLGVLQRNQKRNKRKIVELIERSNIRENRSIEREEAGWPPQDEITSHSDGNLRKKTKLQPMTDLVEDVEVEEPCFQIPLEEGNIINIQVPFPSPPSSSVSTYTARPTATKVRVKVGEHLLLMLMDSNKAEDLTVSWLAQEAAKRYYTLEGQEPKLQITTKDGALLAPSDPISLALDEELIGKILSWKTIPLSERYRFACSVDSVEETTWCNGRKPRYLESLATKLDACSSSLHLSLKNLALDECELKPVVQALGSVRRMHTVDLSGNLLGDDGLAYLAQSLKNCAVENLFLRSTNISENGISCFINSLETMSRDFLTSICTLDLSFNPLGDEGKKIAQQIPCKLPNLSTFKTDHCLSPF